MVQRPDGVVWIVSLLVIISFTLILSIYLIRKGINESKKTFIGLGIVCIITLIVALLVFKLFLAVKANEMFFTLLVFHIRAFQLIEEQLLNSIFAGFALHAWI